MALEKNIRIKNKRIINTLEIIVINYVFILLFFSQLLLIFLQKEHHTIYLCKTINYLPKVRLVTVTKPGFPESWSGVCMLVKRMEYCCHYIWVCVGTLQASEHATITASQLTT